MLKDCQYYGGSAFLQRNEYPHSKEEAVRLLVEQVWTRLVEAGCAELVIEESGFDPQRPIEISVRVCAAKLRDAEV